MSAENPLRRSAAGTSRHPGRGFTLIEVLVALGIGVMVITSVLGSLDYTQKAVDAIHNVIETENQGPKILGLMREDLSRLAVYDAAEYRVLYGESDSNGGADADRIDFLVYRRSLRPHYDLVREEHVWSPLVEVGYRLRRHPNLYDFLELYRREDFMHDEEPYRDGQFTLLYDRVLNFDIRYYEKPDIDPTWEDQWDSSEREALPMAIEVRMEIEVQPRRSKESLDILGANRARLPFEDILTIPEETRWVFRNRLHPVFLAGGQPDRGETEAGDPGAQDDAQGQEFIGGGGGGDRTTQTIRSGAGARDSRGGRDSGRGGGGGGGRGGG